MRLRSEPNLIRGIWIFIAIYAAMIEGVISVAHWVDGPPAPKSSFVVNCDTRPMPKACETPGP